MIHQKLTLESTLQTPPCTPKKEEKYFKSSTYTDSRMKQPSQASSLLCSSPKLINLIGHQRLLASLNRSDYMLPYKSQQFYSSKVIDRFIPNRRMAGSNYFLRDTLQGQQNQQENDPQNISITEIYSQQILGNAGNRGNPINPYRNSNILQYRMRQEKPSIYEFQPSINIPNISSYSKVRKVTKIPCKVLDAPALQDDFYLNLIDWSSDNQLAVGLGNCIYLWNAVTSKVTRLCELYNDLVTSVSWMHGGSILSIGSNKGQILIWDINENKQIRKMGGHEIRVGAMSWSTVLLATGSRDKQILLRDMRSRRDYISRLSEHTQQICGLKWSLDEQYIASGGNDNKIAIWSQGGQLINRFTDHKAAVKAIAWSPQQHGLLATGGGTADRMLKMRNIFTGKIVCEKDTGSQVCNLAFSKSLHQVVSTHGYSQNQINIWAYPSMKKTATLIGHTHRVLYLAINPDGSTIVTGAGDETLRFWNVFPSNAQEQEKQNCNSVIQAGMILR